MTMASAFGRATIVLGVLATSPSASMAQDLTGQSARLGGPTTDGPLTNLKGRWTGSGVATLANGREEPFNCIATYFQDASGTELKQNMRCESPNVSLSTAAQMQIAGDQVTGIWKEKNYEQSGRIDGRLKPNGLTAVVTHNAKQATVDVAATRCEQTVNVSTGPGEVVRNVTASLKRC